jgi:small subunit ribosomal protein S3
MAHKVHPKAFRIKEIADWNSRGFYTNLPEYLEEDFKIREFLNKKIGKGTIEKIEIERSPGKINIIIASSRPGLIIGRGGEEVENLKKLIEKELSKKKITEHYKKIGGELEKRKDIRKEFLKTKKEDKREIRIEIREVKNPWLSASLVSQWIAQQIEKRVPFRRVIKQALAKISANKEIKGARIEVSGRLNGTEIARREWLSTGRLPLQTLRSDIDYAKENAYCTYGTIGIKVWIYKGEKFE